jgi:hypothetical protein
VWEFAWRAVKLREYQRSVQSVPNRGMKAHLGTLLASRN